MPNYSIYTPADPRYNNPSFNQQSGKYGGIQSTPFPGTTTGTGGGAGSGLPNYNVNPGSSFGNGPYGQVPGQIGVPPNAFQQATTAVPGLGNTSQLTGNIMHELQGDINPQTMKNIQDAAASYGVSSGMPGSNAQPGTLAFNRNLRNIGLDTMAVQHQGAQDYNSLLGAVSGLQTPQGLAAEIAAHNAQLAAAPDPTAAANQQLRNYWDALNAQRGPGGGTGGGQPGPAGGTGTAGAGALGFGYGFLGQQGQGTRPANNTVNYGGNFSASAPGIGLGWAGQSPAGFANDLFGDLGAPQAPSYGSLDTTYNPTTDQSVYNPYGGYGYDQTAQPDFSGMTEENYWDNYLAGAGNQ